MEIARGAVVIVSARGAYTGKPRPALVVQTDAFNPTHASVTICPITTACIDACDDVMTRLHRPRGLIRYDSQKALSGGLSVRTTLDPTYQREAKKALVTGLVRFDRSRGWRGVVNHMDIAGGDWLWIGCSLCRGAGANPTSLRAGRRQHCRSSAIARGASRNRFAHKSSIRRLPR